jgi:tetratricopeptide (TPR) repeat protein
VANVGFLSGNKRKKATKLLSEGRTSLPSKSVEKFQKAKKLFDEINDDFQSRIAEAEYFKALGKVALSKKNGKQAILHFEKASILFSSVHDPNSASKLLADINRLKFKYGDYQEVKDRLRRLLNSVDFKNILYEEATRICNALNIDSNTLNELLGQLESEGLVCWTGECYRIMAEDVQRIEVRHVSVDAVQALVCPVCSGKLAPGTTKCQYCGARVKIY